MPSRNETEVEVCPKFQRAVELLGRRWTGAIVQVLRHGPLRFSELSRVVDGITDRVLSERLKELAGEGWIERRVEGGEPPVSVTYSLTTMGRDLGESIDALHDWADRWVAPDRSG